MTSRYPFRIDVLSPLAIGTGEPTLLADDSLPRRLDGRPYIPATTLKGKVRDLTRVAGIDGRQWRQAFGGEDATPSAVLITDAVPSVDDPVETMLISTVALDERRIAITGALTIAEVIAPSGDPRRPSSFHGEVMPSPTAPDPVGLEAAGLVLAGLAAVVDLGARTRRGWGQVRVSLHPESAELAAATIEGLQV